MPRTSVFGSIRSRAVSFFPPAFRRENSYVIFFILILFFGAALRLLGLNRGLWIDEYSSLQLVLDPNFFYRMYRYNSPPLYFFLLHVLTRLSMAEPVLRLLSVIFGVTTVAFIMLTLRYFSSRASLIAGLITAALLSFLEYSLDIRPYALLILSTALSFYFAAQLAFTRKGTSAYVGLALSLTLAILSHAVGIFLPLALFAFLACLPSWSSSKKLFRLALAFGLPGLIFVLLFWLVLRRHALTPWWMPPVSWELVSKVLLTNTGLDAISPNLWAGMLPAHFLDQSPIAILNALALLCGSSVFFVVIPLGDWKKAFPFLASGSAFLGQLIIYSLLFKPIMFDRTAMPSMVPFTMLVSLLLATLPTSALRKLATAALSIVLVLSATQWLRIYSHTARDNSGQVVAELCRIVKRGDMILFDSPALTPLGVGIPDTQLSQNDRFRVNAVNFRTIERVMREYRLRRRSGLSFDAYLVGSSRMSSRRNLELLPKALGTPEVLIPGEIVLYRFKKP